MLLADRPTLAYEDEFCLLATWRSIAIPVMGRAHIPPESAKGQVRALEAHGKRVGKGRMGEATLIAADAPVPDAPTRAILDAGVPLVSPYFCCVSAIFEGEGFRAALVRGVLTSFQLISRVKYPQKVFSSLDECAVWMTPKLQAAGMSIETPSEIVAAMTAVREIAVARGIFGARDRTGGAQVARH